jgi:hypothetical protein
VTEEAKIEELISLLNRLDSNLLHLAELDNARWQLNAIVREQLFELF